MHDMKWKLKAYGLPRTKSVAVRNCPNTRNPVGSTSDRYNIAGTESVMQSVVIWDARRNKKQMQRNKAVALSKRKRDRLSLSALSIGKPKTLKLNRRKRHVTQYADANVRFFCINQHCTWLEFVKKYSDWPAERKPVISFRPHNTRTSVGRAGDNVRVAVDLV